MTATSTHTCPHCSGIDPTCLSCSGTGIHTLPDFDGASYELVWVDDDFLSHVGDFQTKEDALAVAGTFHKGVFLGT